MVTTRHHTQMTPLELHRTAAGGDSQPPGAVTNSHTRTRTAMSSPDNGRWVMEELGRRIVMRRGYLGRGLPSRADKQESQ